MQPANVSATVNTGILLQALFLCVDKQSDLIRPLVDAGTEPDLVLHQVKTRGADSHRRQPPVASGRGLTRSSARSHEPACPRCRCKRMGARGEDGPMSADAKKCISPRGGTCVCCIIDQDRRREPGSPKWPLQSGPRPRACERLCVCLWGREG